MDISLTTLISFIAASAAVAIVPGPNVTIIVANSLRAGTRAGLLTVAGTSFGVLLLIVVLAAGLSAIMEHFGHYFNYLRIAGALYLIYLGIRMWRSDGSFAADDGNGESEKNYFWQGCLVLLANPKALLFFGAFIPQFINPTGDPLVQTMFFGMLFLLTAALFDSFYALIAGKSSDWLNRSKVRRAELTAGAFLIGGGIWLGLMKRS